MWIARGNDRPESENSGTVTTDLTLSLPCGGVKRGFSEMVDLNLENSSEDEASVVTHSSPPLQGEVVGWPPVRSSYRKKTINNSKFVKVAADGAPYLRKLDLQIYSSYEELLAAFEDMFTCLTICDVVNEMKIDSANGREYVATYEDKDGDWMLVGDVPWKMFVDSCKRLRLMKSSEAIGLAPKTISRKGSQASSSR